MDTARRGQSLGAVHWADVCALPAVSDAGCLAAPEMTVIDLSFFEGALFCAFFKGNQKECYHVGGIP